MQKYLKQLFVGITSCLVLGSAINVYGLSSHSPQLERIRDVGTNIENNKNWTYKFIFPNQETLLLKNDGYPFTFLMIDGEVTPNLNLPIINNRSFIPLRFLGTSLDMNVSWDDSSKTALISKGNVIVSVPAAKNSLEIQLINNSIYVSIRFLEKNFPLTVSYRPFVIDENDPFNILLHPLVTIDSHSFKFTLSESQAIVLAKSELMRAYSNFLNNKSYNTGSKDSSNTLSLLKNDIESISCVNKISRYYILNGPYLTLVDGVTGKIYFLKEKINKSFIAPLNVLDPEIFADNYFVG